MENPNKQHPFNGVIFSDTNNLTIQPRTRMTKNYNLILEEVFLYNICWPKGNLVSLPKLPNMGKSMDFGTIEK